jgi:hypothetical protein
VTDHGDPGGASTPPTLDGSNGPSDPDGASNTVRGRARLRDRTTGTPVRLTASSRSPSSACRCRFVQSSTCWREVSVKSSRLCSPKSPSLSVWETRGALSVNRLCGIPHNPFGGRARETDRLKGRHRALVRPYETRVREGYRKVARFGHGWYMRCHRGVEALCCWTPTTTPRRQPGCAGPSSSMSLRFNGWQLKGTRSTTPWPAGMRRTQSDSERR